MFDASDIASQGNGSYLSSESTVIIDTQRPVLAHFITHMNESLEQSLKIECDRLINEFKHTTQAIVNQHNTKVNDYINSNICDIITDKY